MSFASIEFFLFLPLVFTIYYLHRGKAWQNTVLVVASYIFYARWDYRFCLLMLASSLVDYAAGLMIQSTQAPPRRKAVLIIALSGNLVILGFFKYFNFFVDSLIIGMSALGIDANTLTLQIILPVGISFYTFQTMSYTIDIYRGSFQPQRNLIDYLAFVSFFPQLVAGPIERAANLLPQFRSARAFSYPAAVEGCQLILWGLAKKMILADNLGGIVNTLYASPQHATGGSLALATVCFAFQIYCDFSAYSDIAAGVASLFGIRLMRNFAYPYFSQSLAEFWRRWHISLSTWLRDYIYIPLGGSRAGPSRTARNLLLTFIISGIWHGAAWKFIAWGALHGLYLVGGLACRNSLGIVKKSSAATVDANQPPNRLVTGLRIVRTFLLVCIGWVLFRADNLGEAMTIYQRMASSVFGLGFYQDILQIIRQHAAIFALLLLAGILEWKHRDRWNPLPIPQRSTLSRWATYTLVFWAILYFGTRRTAEFIYFQF